jgi:hypothetical protein
VCRETDTKQQWAHDERTGQLRNRAVNICLAFSLQKRVMLASLCDTKNPQQSWRRYAWLSMT